MKYDHTEKAAALFTQGYNCAQAVFAAFSDVTGMDEKLAIRLSSSFGGGMGRMREVAVPVRQCLWWQESSMVREQKRIMLSKQSITSVSSILQKNFANSTKRSCAENC